jgi:hypothetical protein
MTSQITVSARSCCSPSTYAHSGKKAQDDRTNGYIIVSTSILLILGMVTTANAQEASAANSVGVGVGWAAVSDGRLDQSMSDVAYSARFSHRHSDRVRFVGEFAVYGIHDEDPSSLDVVDVPPGTIFLRRPAILETQALLFSVQVGKARGMFIRPGAGISLQRLALYHPVPSSNAYEAESAFEGTLGLGVAGGREFAVRTRGAISVEGFVFWGAKSTSGPRWVVGVQAVPLLKF